MFQQVSNVWSSSASPKTLVKTYVCDQYWFPPNISPQFRNKKYTRIAVIWIISNVVFSNGWWQIICTPLMLLLPVRYMLLLLMSCIYSWSSCFWPALATVCGSDVHYHWHCIDWTYMMPFSSQWGHMEMPSLFRIVSISKIWLTLLQHVIWLMQRPKHYELFLSALHWSCRHPLPKQKQLHCPLWKFEGPAKGSITPSYSKSQYMFP